MLNNTMIQCRLVADPELRDTNSGAKVVNFRIAWSEKVKDRDDNKLFLECKAFSGLAEHIAKYYTKGQEIIVEGKLHTEEWTSKEGQKRSKNVLMVNNCHFCGKKQDNGTARTEQGGFTEVEEDRLPF